jgi:hypothetical protein
MLTRSSLQTVIGTVHHEPAPSVLLPALIAAGASTPSNSGRLRAGAMRYFLDGF